MAQKRHQETSGFAEVPCNIPPQRLGGPCTSGEVVRRCVYVDVIPSCSWGSNRVAFWGASASTLPLRNCSFHSAGRTRRPGDCGLDARRHAARPGSESLRFLDIQSLVAFRDTFDATDHVRRGETSFSTTGSIFSATVVFAAVTFVFVNVGLGLAYSD